MIRYIENYKASKSIIVVHNLKDVRTKDLHLLVWESQVTKIFKEFEQNDGRVTSVSMKDPESGMQISQDIPIYKTTYSLHVSLVNNYSEYGYKYNLFGIQLIKDLLRRQIIRSRKQNIYNRLIENIKMTLNNAELSIEESDGERIIKPKNEDQVDGLISNLSYSLIRPDEFEPAYDCVKIENKYHIILDVPGMQKEDFNIIHDNNRTIVAGTRTKNHTVEDACAHRKSGTFKLEFPIPAAFNSAPESISLKDGLLGIVFPPFVHPTVSWIVK